MVLVIGRWFHWFLCKKLASFRTYAVIFDSFSSGRYENVEGVLKKYADKVCLLKVDYKRPNTACGAG